MCHFLNFEIKIKLEKINFTNSSINILNQRISFSSNVENKEEKKIKIASKKKMLFEFRKLNQSKRLNEFRKIFAQKNGRRRCIQLFFQAKKREIVC